jgi:hypothetical protein
MADTIPDNKEQAITILDLGAGYARMRVIFRPRQNYAVMMGQERRYRDDRT